MIAYISEDGQLVIKAEDPTECFALNVWSGIFKSCRKKVGMIDIETNLDKVAEFKVGTQVQMQEIAKKMQEDNESIEAESEQRIGFKYENT